jgi:hypothetical protein
VNHTESHHIVTVKMDMLKWTKSVSIVLINVTNVLVTEKLVKDVKVT